jgi:hypothetical protein
LRVKKVIYNGSVAQCFEKVVGGLYKILSFWDIYLFIFVAKPSVVPY